MLTSCIQCLFVVILILSQAWCTPVLRHDQEPHQPLSGVTQLGSRVASRVQEQRLGLPTPQDLEAIKKVAQILVMLGDQVIPAIIGESAPQSSICDLPTIEDVPNDVIDNN